MIGPPSASECNTRDRAGPAVIGTCQGKVEMFYSQQSRNVLFSYELFLRVNLEPQERARRVGCHADEERRRPGPGELQKPSERERRRGPAQTSHGQHKPGDGARPLHSRIDANGEADSVGQSRGAVGET